MLGNFPDKVKHGVCLEMSGPDITAWANNWVG